MSYVLKMQVQHDFLNLNVTVKNKWYLAVCYVSDCTCVQAMHATHFKNTERSVDLNSTI